MMTVRVVAAGLLMVVLAIVAGCGRDIQNPVSGTVVHQGQPVADGVVRFTPDVNKGFKGPSVNMPIENGTFTARNQEADVAPGEHMVTVTVIKPGATEGQLEDFEFRVTVPEGGIQDLKFDLAEGKRAK